MKLRSYSESTSLNPGDIFIHDGQAGTHSVTAKTVANEFGKLIDESALRYKPAFQIDFKELYFPYFTIGQAGMNACYLNDNFIYKLLNQSLSFEQRKTVFRGKNLGTAYTPAQRSAIVEGTFDDLFLGDYWEYDTIVNNQRVQGKARIVDFDYWYGKGPSSSERMDTHHIVVMCSNPTMNNHLPGWPSESDGYVGSYFNKLSTYNRTSLANNLFGTSNVLERWELLINSIKNGKPAGVSWYQTKGELPNEPMIFGSFINTPANDGTTSNYFDYSGSGQFLLYRTHPEFIFEDLSVGAYGVLRDSSTSESWCLAGRGGIPAVSNPPSMIPSEGTALMMYFAPYAIGGKV